jgi:hypothetical protein
MVYVLLFIAVLLFAIATFDHIKKTFWPDNWPESKKKQLTK